MILSENQMATTRVTAHALAMMLDFPEEIEIKDIEIAEIDDDFILVLKIEGTHPVTGDELGDQEYELQYALNENHDPMLVGIEPINSESS